jgi:hypothetical protein
MMRELTEPEKATLRRRLNEMLGEITFIDLLNNKLQCFGRKARLMIECDDEPVPLTVVSDTPKDGAL